MHMVFSVVERELVRVGGTLVENLPNGTIVLEVDA